MNVKLIKSTVQKVSDFEKNINAALAASLVPTPFSFSQQFSFFIARLHLPKYLTRWQFSPRH
jgi:hypothetical protein